ISDDDETVRYHDEDLTQPNDPYEIDAATMRRTIRALDALRMHDDPDKLSRWFGRFITTYRTSSTIAPDTTTTHRETLEHALAAGDELIRRSGSRTAWCRTRHDARLFCGGLEFTLTCKDAQYLAATERLNIHAYTQLSEPGRTALLNLLAHGHYQLDHNILDNNANDQETS
ncbi:MAG TPA: winged helix domain-containing protein, partial [Xylella sp.]